MLRAVIFDLDDTLIDWSHYKHDWQAVRQNHLRPVVERLGAQGHALPPLAELAELYNTLNEAAWSAAVPPDFIAPRQIDVMREMLVQAGIRVEPAALADLQEAFAWGPLPGVTLFPDTIDVLEAIRAAGLRTGLMTNASSPMWMRDRELEALGLIDYLDIRFTAGDVGHLKPHPRPFEAVLEGLGVAPQEAVFVGDRLFSDILGAQGVGMAGVWVRRHEQTDGDGIEPDAIIDQLAELLPRLDAWYPGWRDHHSSGDHVDHDRNQHGRDQVGGNGHDGNHQNGGAAQ
jgi:putative hydrolase of the HAD superfamily